MSENNVKNAIIEYLIYRGALILRINSGATINGGESEKRRFLSFVRWYILGHKAQTAGVSDVLALLPPAVDDSSLSGYFKNPNPILVAVECKSPNRRQRNGQSAAPSPEQALFLEAVRERGGLALVVDDVEQLIKELESRGY